MKTYITYLIIALAFTACNNDDDNNSQDPLSQLPPMTTTGENTIGCLVNGEPFTDSGLMNNFYQFVGDESVLAINWERGFTGNVKLGQIVLRNTQINEEEIYILNKSNFLENDYTGGGALFFTDIEPEEGQYETNQNFTGQIFFTRFDDENNIMSGTFSFEAQEINTGEIINITDGRFDLTFTN